MDTVDIENYVQGKKMEEPITKDNLPLPSLPRNFLWMQVRNGSKIKNLLSHALAEFPRSGNLMVWTGYGPAMGKAITCAEIMKREYGDNLHQITRICYRISEEFWDPKIPELVQLIVKRKSPVVHILLSASTLSHNELGYQAPGGPFMSSIDEKTLRELDCEDGGTPTEELAALGVGSSGRPKQPSRNSYQSTEENPQPSCSTGAVGIAALFK